MESPRSTEFHNALFALMPIGQFVHHHNHSHNHSQGQTRVQNREPPADENPYDAYTTSSTRSAHNSEATNPTIVTERDFTSLRNRFDEDEDGESERSWDEGGGSGSGAAQVQVGGGGPMDPQLKEDKSSREDAGFLLGIEEPGDPITVDDEHPQTQIFHALSPFKGREGAALQSITRDTVTLVAAILVRLRKHLHKLRKKPKGTDIYPAGGGKEFWSTGIAELSVKNLVDAIQGQWWRRNRIKTEQKEVADNLTGEGTKLDEWWKQLITAVVVSYFYLLWEEAADPDSESTDTLKGAWVYKLALPTQANLFLPSVKLATYEWAGLYKFGLLRSVQGSTASADRERDRGSSGGGGDDDGGDDLREQLEGERRRRRRAERRVGELEEEEEEEESYSDEDYSDEDEEDAYERGRREGQRQGAFGGYIMGRGGLYHHRSGLNRRSGRRHNHAPEDSPGIVPSRLQTSTDANSDQEAARLREAVRELALGLEYEHEYEHASAQASASAPRVEAAGAAPAPAPAPAPKQDSRGPDVMRVGANSSPSHEDKVKKLVGNDVWTDAHELIIWDSKPQGSNPKSRWIFWNLYLRPKRGAKTVTVADIKAEDKALRGTSVKYVTALVSGVIHAIRDAERGRAFENYKGAVPVNEYVTRIYKGPGFFHKGKGVKQNSAILAGVSNFADNESKEEWWANVITAAAVALHWKNYNEKNVGSIVDIYQPKTHIKYDDEKRIEMRRTRFWRNEGFLYPKTATEREDNIKKNAERAQRKQNNNGEEEYESEYESDEDEGGKGEDDDDDDDGYGYGEEYDEEEEDDDYDEYDEDEDEDDDDEDNTRAPRYGVVMHGRDKGDTYNPYQYQYVHSDRLETNADASTRAKKLLRGHPRQIVHRKTNGASSNPYAHNYDGSEDRGNNRSHGRSGGGRSHLSTDTRSGYGGHVRSYNTDDRDNDRDRAPPPPTRDARLGYGDTGPRSNNPPQYHAAHSNPTSKSQTPHAPNPYAQYTSQSSGHDAWGLADDNPDSGNGTSGHGYLHGHGHGNANAPGGSGGGGEGGSGGSGVQYVEDILNSPQYHVHADRAFQSLEYDINQLKVYVPHSLSNTRTHRVTQGLFTQEDDNPDVAFTTPADYHRIMNERNTTGAELIFDPTLGVRLETANVFKNAVSPSTGSSLTVTQIPGVGTLAWVPVVVAVPEPPVDTVRSSVSISRLAPSIIVPRVDTSASTTTSASASASAAVGIVPRHGYGHESVRGVAFRTTPNGNRVLTFDVHRSVGSGLAEEIHSQMLRQSDGVPVMRAFEVPQPEATSRELRYAFMLIPEAGGNVQNNLGAYVEDENAVRDMHRLISLALGIRTSDRPSQALEPGEITAVYNWNDLRQYVTTDNKLVFENSSAEPVDLSRAYFAWSEPVVTLNVPHPNDVLLRRANPAPPAAASSDAEYVWFTPLQYVPSHSAANPARARVDAVSRLEIGFKHNHTNGHTSSTTGDLVYKIDVDTLHTSNIHNVY